MRRKIWDGLNLMPSMDFLPRSDLASEMIEEIEDHLDSLPEAAEAVDRLDEDWTNDE